MESLNLFWGWFALAALFLVMEMVLPGFAFLWIGLAAAIVGVIVFVAPMLSLPIQLALFGVLGVAAYFISRRFLPHKTREEPGGIGGNVHARYIGTIVTLDEAIQNGRGRARVGDTTWAVVGPDAPAGTPVKIIGLKDETTFRVEPSDHPII